MQTTEGCSDPRRSPGLAACAVLLAGWLAGCVTAVPGARPDLLDFLKEGGATREAVMLTLGQPSASFEHERILTYRVGHESEQGYYVISPKTLLPWQHVRYSLVLVFHLREQGYTERNGARSSGGSSGVAPGREHT